MREYNFHEAFNFHQKKALKTSELLRIKVEQLLMSQTKIMVGKKQPVSEKSFLRSHFGGTPYFEAGEQWPVHKITGEPMEFVCQFVSTEGFPFPEDLKLIQLFFSFSYSNSEHFEDAWYIKTYNDIQVNKFTHVPNPSGKLNAFYNPAYMVMDVSLPDFETAITVNPIIHYLCKKISRRKPNTTYDKMVHYLMGDTEYGSAIGGWPNWLYHESNFDINFYKQGYRLLAQLDNECQAGLCWGDVGTAYLFYNLNDKNKYEFLLQAF
jgi:uncharacterized protein YwqG